MTIKNTEKLIDSYINKAVKGKQAFYENLQTAFEVFVGNYNTTLNHNSQPLFKILKACGKEITLMKDYVYSSTNITKLSLSDKGGLKLTFDGEFTFNDSFIDSNKWYDKALKADKKAIKELDDNALYKAINALLKRVKDSNKVTKKDYFIRQLTTLSNSKA